MEPREKRWEDCMVKGCTARGRPRTCPGDGRHHHHGAIHTIDGTQLDLGDWGWLCDKHYATAEAEWVNKRIAGTLAQIGEKCPTCGGQVEVTQSGAITCRRFGSDHYRAETRIHA